MKKIAFAHNGIIENHTDIKKELRARGCRFRSETDTEVAANLIGYYHRKHSFRNAFLKAVARLTGFFAFVVMSKEEPGRLWVFRRSNPLVIGLVRGENFIASDVSALLAHTQNFLFLEDDEYAEVAPSEVKIYSFKTRKLVIRKPVKTNGIFLRRKKTAIRTLCSKKFMSSRRFWKGLSLSALTQAAAFTSIRLEAPREDGSG